MRTYPHNSPQAAARIVTLAMLADGAVCGAEIDALDRSDAHQQLGLRADEWDAVVHHFCDDLREAGQSTTWAAAVRIEPRTLDDLMAEIVDPALRLKVLRLCVSVFEADGNINDGEAIMLGTAVEQWGLHREILQPDWFLPEDTLPTRPRDVPHG